MGAQAGLIGIQQLPQPVTSQTRLSPRTIGQSERRTRPDVTGILLRNIALCAAMHPVCLRLNPRAISLEGAPCAFLPANVPQQGRKVSLRLDILHTPYAKLYALRYPES